MKFTCLRLAEIAAATLVSSAVLLVAVTPAVIGAPVHSVAISTKYVEVLDEARPAAPAWTLNA